MVKVDITTGLASRLAALQTRSPDPLRMAFSAPAFGNAYTVEQETHRILAPQRGSGEWFSVTPDLAIAAIYAATDRTGCSLAGLAPSRQQPLSDALSEASVLVTQAAFVLGFGAVALLPPR
jgi:hypothetical protein